MAKPGQKKESLSEETTVRMLKRVKQFVRCDFGGQDPLTTIRGKMKAEGINCNEKSQRAIHKIVTEQVEGCRRRSFPRINEAIKRLEGKDI